LRIILATGRGVSLTGIIPECRRENLKRILNIQAERIRSESSLCGEGRIHRNSYHLQRDFKENPRHVKRGEFMSNPHHVERREFKRNPLRGEFKQNPHYRKRR
jgi:hypothetical protein